MLIVWLTLHHIDLCISLGCFKIFFHMTSVATQQGEWVCFQKKNMHLPQTTKNSFAARKHLMLGQVFLVRKTKFPSYNHSISILKYLNKLVIYITLSYDLSISMSSLLTASICLLLPHAQCRVIASLLGWGLAEGSHAG